MTRYRYTPFTCGNCGKALAFMSKGLPFPGAWYVHRDDHRFRCYGARFFGPNTHTKGIK